MTASALAQFRLTASTLNTEELAMAYMRLWDTQAPMQCLDIVLDMIIDNEGLEYAEGLVEGLS